MMVNGPLEIYATVIGARMYDNIFNILVSFGIAFLPLLSLFFNSVSIFFETKFGDVSEISLKKTGFHLFLYVFSIMLFVAPTHRLDVTGITYKPVCAKNATVSRFGDTGTTYDNAFENFDYQNIRIPWGAAFILTGISGITNAAIVSLPCKTDVQAIQNTIDTTRLTPMLVQQVTRFQNECYAAARAKFDNEYPDESSYKNIMSNYGGQSDLSWMGSHTLDSLYYENLYPTSPVQGFSYTAYPYQYQEFNKKAGDTPPKWGFPNCSEWWNDSENGLKTKLVQLVEKHNPNNPHLGEVSVTSRLSSWLAKVKRFSHIGSQITSEDVVVHSLLYDEGSESGFGRRYAGWMDDSLYAYGNTDSKRINRLAAGVRIGDDIFAQTGQAGSAVFASVKRAEVAQEVPILQAVLMVLCLSLGPVILMLGNYRLYVIFSYYFILASIISVTFLEKLIHYIELSLHASMSYGFYSLGNAAILYNVFTELYLLVPLIYLMVMSVCGVQVGSSLKGIFNLSAAGAGAEYANKTVTNLNSNTNQNN